MAQKGGAVAAAQIDVFLAVEVPKPASFRSIEIQGMAQGLIDARRRGDAARKILARLVELIDNAGHGETSGALLRPWSDWAPGILWPDYTNGRWTGRVAKDPLHERHFSSPPR